MTDGIEVFVITDAGNLLMPVPKKMVHGCFSSSEILNHYLVGGHFRQRPVKRDDGDATGG
jgi:hypothetical protein